MTTFRFNFSGSDNNSDNTDLKENIEWFESEEIIPDKQIKDLDKIVVRANMLVCEEVEIGHVMASDAVANIEGDGFKNAVKLAENEHSDLVTGKYEGGLKIWECTTDLLKYLVDNENTISFENKKVLDLGCGAGILGIYAFMKLAHVTFQDYNKEVLEHVTIPNVLLNIDNEESRESEIKRCKFYSGDWSSFSNKTNETYDIILTSETIYNESNYDKLISLFENMLSDNGVIYLAAKTYYFGVGGGTRQFEKRITENDLFNCEVCWTSTGGVQREILKLTKKSTK